MTNNYNIKPLKNCIKIRMKQKLYLVKQNSKYVKGNLVKLQFTSL